jgi:hypothetical protein
VVDGMKADMILREPDEWGESAFGRRVRIDDPAFGPVWVSSPEDLIIAKLEFSESGRSSRQMDDCRVIVRTQPDLDWEYLERHSLSGSPISSPAFAEPGQVELDAALAAMSPAERLARFWRLQEIAVARSWALVERSSVSDPAGRIELVIRSRYPEWSEEEVERLLSAIRAREDPAIWLDRLRDRAVEITARLQSS